MFINHPVIKIVLHVLISSFGISTFGTHITNMSHWLYQASKGQSVLRNDHLDTEIFYLLLFLFWFIVFSQSFYVLLLSNGQ